MNDMDEYLGNHLNQRKVYLCNFKYLKLNDENQTN